MTRKKLADWLTKQGYTTTPDKITTARLSQIDNECGAHSLWIEVNKNSVIYSISCLYNLHEITKELKKGYELEISTKWGSLVLNLRRNTNTL